MRAQIRLAAVIGSLTLLAGVGLAGYTDSGSSHLYVVQPGDSLWAIAHRSGTTVSQLAAVNGLNPNGILPIGRQLTIPSSGAAVVQTTSASTSTSGNGSSQISGQTASAGTFCASFVANSGPYGVLPQVLSQSPSRLALIPTFQKWAYHFGLSLPLLEAVDWQESGWQEGVVSVTGAVGVGQIEPGTGAFIDANLVRENLNAASTSDNIAMSAALLAYLADQEGNSRCLTIAAYYEGTVNLSKYGVFPDTQAYVASVEALLPRFE